MAALEALIIGAGQAGLGLSHKLTAAALEHVVLEKGAVGRAWREDRWDSFSLVTPNWTITLPGAEYDGPAPDGFMSGQDFANLLDRWADSFSAPVRTGIEVRRLRRDGDAFIVETDGGVWRARQVAVAAATYQHARTPSLSAGVAGDVLQLHASRYRNPAALPAGAVLVVGSGQSGCQIAEELNAAKRTVYLSVGRSGRLPRRYRGKDCIDWQRRMGLLDRTPDMLDDPAHRFRGDPHLSGANGGYTLSLHDLRRAGVRLTGRLLDVDAGGRRLAFADDLEASVTQADLYAANFRRMTDVFIESQPAPAPPPSPDEMKGEPEAGRLPLRSPESLDLQAAGIGCIVWATGFAFDFSWIEPDESAADGYPRTTTGVAATPGLYFMGLNWLPKRKSGIIYGVAEDADRIGEAMLRRAAAR